MRLLKILLIAAIAVGLSAASANALTTVSHTNDTGGAVLDVGDTFNVDVSVAWDEQSVLTGIFTSAGWDPSILSLTGSTTAPFLLFGPGAQGFLGKVVDPSVFPGDPAGTIRTAQFVAASGQSASLGFAGTVLISTLTFQVVGVPAGLTTDIDVVLNAGDICLGAGGFECAGIDFATAGTSVSIIPEPGTALLMGLGLVGLGYAGRRG